MTALVVHGGCGIWLSSIESKAVAGCRDAVSAGQEILFKGRFCLRRRGQSLRCFREQPYL